VSVAPYVPEEVGCFFANLDIKFGAQAVDFGVTEALFHTKRGYGDYERCKRVAQLAQSRVPVVPGCEEKL